MTKTTDGREVFINYRKTLEKITTFRHMTEKEQDALMYKIRSDTIDLIHRLEQIQKEDKLVNH